MRPIYGSFLPSLMLTTLALGGVAGCSDDDNGSSKSGGPGTKGYSGSGAVDPSQIPPGGYIDRPGTIPLFPGSGTSDASDPLPNGMICDSVPLAGPTIEEPKDVCYFDMDKRLAATLEQVLECVEDANTIHIRLTFHPWFVDNTYGANAIGWDARAPMDMPMDPTGKMPKMPKMAKGGHTFKDLVGSDHAEIVLKNGAGEVALHFKLDYISEDPSRPSGYGSLGVTGGEGKMIVGPASAVVKWMTSFDLDLNERGYGSYTTDSPATDEFYTPNPATPDWDYRVVYEAWIDHTVFGSSGFGGASIEFVHASPSKAESNTLTVEPGDCPCQHADPDETCKDYPPPDGGTTDPCLDNDPDTWCGDSGVPPPPPGEPTPFCKEHPEDPSCNVD